MPSCLVLGGAASLWPDIEAARALGIFDGAVACNDAGSVWPGHLDAWVTLHPIQMPAWRQKRARNGYGEAAAHIAHERGTGIDRVADYRWPEMETSGSSGLFATKIALELGFDRVVLCGIPMTREAHYFDSKEWKAVDKYTAAWIAVKDRLSNRVKSTSGWTASLLGRPDQSWLAEYQRFTTAKTQL